MGLQNQHEDSWYLVVTLAIWGWPQRAFKVTRSYQRLRYHTISKKMMGNNKNTMKFKSLLYLKKKYFQIVRHIMLYSKSSLVIGGRIILWLLLSLLQPKQNWYIKVTVVKWGSISQILLVQHQILFLKTLFLNSLMPHQNKNRHTLLTAPALFIRPKPQLTDQSVFLTSSLVTCDPPVWPISTLIAIGWTPD